MLYATDDLRIATIKPLIPPAILMEEIPLDDETSSTVTAARRDIAAILAGEDDRLVVITGPCSVHNVAAAHRYAALLAKAADRLSEDLLLVMRVYFEKPRTTVGWKGLINDPHLDGSFAINHGLRLARGLLRDINHSGVPAGCEFLDTITPQFIADLVSWGAIGARTTESQVHRELASGLSMSVGFKNGTGGDIQVCIDAMLAAREPHHFLSVTKQGLSAIVATKGNHSTHPILRGGSDGSNYSVRDVAEMIEILHGQQLPPTIMIDCSHANSGKDPIRQIAVAEDIARQIAAGQTAITGIMLESHLKGGRQDPSQAQNCPDTSVTDACLSWDQTLPVLETLAQSVRDRRRA